MRSTSLFDSFTRQYALSKTLRFELRPTDKTKKLLESEGIIPKDKAIHAAYQAIKPVFDDLHRKFIDESLSDFKLKYAENAYRVWKEWKNEMGPKEKKTLDEALRGKNGKGGLYGDFRLGIVTRFNEIAKQWKEEQYKSIEFKKDGVEILFEEHVLELLKKVFPEDSEKLTVFIKDADNNRKHIVDVFKRFFTYFEKFSETRRNLYSVDTETTALAHRMVDMNTERFFRNRFVFEKISEEYHPSIFLTGTSSNFEANRVSQTFLQCGIENYNIAIGDANKLINEYCQKNGIKKIDRFQRLQNQILGRRDKKIFLEAIESDEKLFECLRSLHKEAEQDILDSTGKSRVETLDSIIHETFEISEESVLEKVYFSKAALNTILYKFLTPDGINVLLGEGGLGKKKSKKNDSDEVYSIPASVSVALLKKALQKMNGRAIWKEHILECRAKNSDTEDNFRIFADHFVSQFQDIGNGYVDSIAGKKVAGHSDAKALFENLFSRDAFDSKKGEKETEIQTIKSYLDSLLRYLRMAKYFSFKGIEKVDTDQQFYSVLEEYLGEYSLTNIYDAVRNYLTRKPWSEEKMKLNFEEGKLLGGWADSPYGNTQFHSLLFRREGKYFLGIASEPKLFDKKKHPEAYTGNGYEKMIYRQLKSQTLYGSVYMGEYGKKYKDDLQEIDDDEAVRKVKELLKKYILVFPSLQEIIQKEYVDPKHLARDISALTLYSITWEWVSDDFVERGEYPQKKADMKRKDFLFLFEIFSRDIRKKKGIQNLHSLYWNELFSSKNISNPVLKLNGQAEIFFRPETMIAEEEIRSTTDGTKKFSVIKNKRYTEDKFLFHCPIVLNCAKAEVNDRFRFIHFSRFNDQLNSFLSERKSEISILGIDRGEKHLAYYALLDADGTLKESGSFNMIQEGNKQKLTDYLGKLEVREEERKKAREEWRAIGKIKDLKNGYVSQVVRKIADLALENNAIIVLEDLNTGFKRGRQKIERQVYQKLELALAKKLNYLVNKTESDPKAPGHPIKGYQLVPSIANYKDIEGKPQAGIMLYTRAGYTSAICPECGWRRKPGMWEGYSNETQVITFLKNISLEKRDGSYIISHRGKTEKKKNKKGGEYEAIFQPETLSTKNALRWQWKQSENSGKGGIKKYDVTEKLDRLFEKFGISVDGDIIKNILSSEKKLEAELYRSLLSLIGLLTKIRNSYKEEKGGKEIEHDSIHCPCCGFHSDNGFHGKEWNGDANGAYNIARKGIMMLDRIADFEKRRASGALEKDEKYPRLFIADADWDTFAQRK